MITGYVLICGHGLMVAALNILDQREVIEIDWDIVRLGIMGEAAVGMIMLLNKLSVFL